MPTADNARAPSQGRARLFRGIPADRFSTVDELADALRPIAALGVPPLRGFPPSTNLQGPFPGRTDAEVLYRDDYGHQLTIGDCRRAATTWGALHGYVTR